MLARLSWKVLARCSGLCPRWCALSPADFFRKTIQCNVSGPCLSLSCCQDPKERAGGSRCKLLRPTRSAQGSSHVCSQLSELEDVIFNDFIMDDFIQDENEQEILEALGDYKCDAGMSVENVPAVVNIKTLKG